MIYPPPRRRSPVPLVLALVAVVLVVAVAAVLAVALLTRSDDDPASPPATAQRLSAGEVISILDRRNLVDANDCRDEAGAPPATSQSRCDLGEGDQLIAMGFADGAGVRERLGGWLGSGTLVRGPNWLVNVADMATEYQEQVRAALGGTLVQLSG